MSREGTYEREPTFIERYEIVRSIKEVYSNFNVTAKYSKHVDQAVLSQALRNVLLKNPSLAMNYFRKEGRLDDTKEQGNNFVRRPVQKITFDGLVTYRKLPGGALDESVLRDFNEMVFDLNKEAPLWKLIISDSEESQHFTFICNHIIGDANAACFFHEDLVNEISQVQSSDHKTESLDVLLDFTNDKESLPPFPKSTADLIDLYNPSLWYKVSTIVEKLFVPKFVSDFVNRYVFPHDFEEYPLFSNGVAKLHAKAKYKIVNISAIQSKELLPSLRAKKATFTPYFSAVALQTLQEIVFPCVSKKQYSTNLSVIINGRRYYPDFRDQLKYNMAATVCSVVQKPMPSSKGIEGLSEPIKCISDSVTRDLESRNGFYMVGLLRTFNLWDFLSQIGEADSRATMEISNIGNKVIKSQDLEVEDLIFSQDNGVSPHLVFSSVSTPAGGMNIVIGFREDLDKLILPESNEKAMDVFARELKSRLIEYAQ